MISIRRLSCLVCLLLPLQAQTGENFSGVAEVIDGDSLRVDGQELRLWGIDAVEYRQTCERDGRLWQCGRAAARALRGHLRGHKIHCTERARDRHGRSVAICHSAGRSINDWMVRQGWALDYRRYSSGEFAAAEAEARSARRGVWSSEFMRPEPWRRANPR